MSSRLYPGFGSGKGKYEAQFIARSLKSARKDAMSASDKIILPTEVLKEIKRLRLPFPLLFEIESERYWRAKVASDTAERAPIRSTFGTVSGSRIASRRTTGSARREGKGRGRGSDKSSVRGRERGGKGAAGGRGRGSKGPSGPGVPRPPKAAGSKLYCGVTEFSAPVGTAFLPSWMFPALRIKEGSRVHVVSAKNPPKGEFARFRPHKTAFIDLAAAFGPRELMEQAMKHYSTLSTGRTVLVEAAGERYKLDVLELKPSDSISLYGDLDLEVDFAPPKDMEEEGGAAGGGGGVMGMDLGMGMGMGMGAEASPEAGAAATGAADPAAALPLAVDPATPVDPLAGKARRLGGSPSAGGGAKSPAVAATREARAAARLRRLQAMEDRRKQAESDESAAASGASTAPSSEEQDAYGASRAHGLGNTGAGTPGLRTSPLQTRQKPADEIPAESAQTADPVAKGGGAPPGVDGSASKPSRPGSARRPGSRGALGLIRGMSAARKRQRQTEQAEAAAQAAAEAAARDKAAAAESTAAGAAPVPPVVSRGAVGGRPTAGGRKVATSATRLAVANARAVAAASEVREQVAVVGTGDLRGGVAPPDWARQQLLRRRGTSVQAQRARPKLYATLDAASVPEGIPAMDPETGAVVGGPEPEAAKPVSAFQGQGHSAGGGGGGGPRPISPILQSPNRRRVLRDDESHASAGPSGAATYEGAGTGESKEEGEDGDGFDAGAATGSRESPVAVPPASSGSGFSDDAKTKLRGKGVVMEFAPPGGRRKRLRGAFSGQASLGRQRAAFAQERAAAVAAGEVLDPVGEEEVGEGGERNFFAGPSHSVASRAAAGGVDEGGEDGDLGEDGEGGEAEGSPAVSPGVRRREQARLRLARMGR